MSESTTMRPAGLAGITVPRLEAEEFREDVAAYLGPRVKRLGYLGEFFRCTGHQPDALLDFMRFTESSKKGLPEKLVELIALTAAVENGNAYERNQHERLSIRLGYGADWVASVERLDPDVVPGLDDIERQLQRFILAAIRTSGHGAGDELSAFIAATSAEQAVAAMFVLGRYAVHALIVNSLGLAPPVPSIFEDGFRG